MGIAPSREGGKGSARRETTVLAHGLALCLALTLVYGGGGERQDRWAG